MDVPKAPQEFGEMSKPMPTFTPKVTKPTSTQFDMYLTMSMYKYMCICKSVNLSLNRPICKCKHLNDGHVHYLFCTTKDSATGLSTKSTARLPSGPAWFKDF